MPAGPYLLTPVHDTTAVPTLWTIGHSTREWDEFLTLLEGERIEAVVDLRRFPGSRR